MHFRRSDTVVIHYVGVEHDFFHYLVFLQPEILIRAGEGVLLTETHIKESERKFCHSRTVSTESNLSVDNDFCMIT